MAENVSAFAAYNAANVVSVAAVNYTNKKKKNKNKNQNQVKPAINKKKLDGNVSNQIKKNKQQIATTLPETFQNGLVENANPIPSTSNGGSNQKTGPKIARTAAQRKAYIQHDVTTISVQQVKKNSLNRSSLPMTDGIGSQRQQQQPRQRQSIANNTHEKRTNDHQQMAEGNIAHAKNTLSWLIEPRSIDEFMKINWEKEPLFIARKSMDKYSQLLSTAEIDQALREQIVEFTKNIDVTSYQDGVRKTHNPEGRAMPHAVWEFYNSGCSIRMLNPQTFFPKIHQLNATLQEYFHCMAGANFYLTPPNSQGFAPHYDDIEAFVLQLEGKKLWKLYRPRTEQEILPRESSENLNPDEIGEPLFEQILEPGDLLYFPRGTIHQAHTVPGHHSLHITLSFYQKMSYTDLLEHLIPQALQNAADSDIDFRCGVPLDIWNNMGLIHTDNQSIQRIAIRRHLEWLFSKLLNHIDLDGAVDTMALKYQHDALPPFLSPYEKVRTSYGAKSKLKNNGQIVPRTLKPDTKFRLLRANIVRLIAGENEAYRLYYYSDNSKEYHEFDLNYTEIDGEAAMTVEYIIKAYPRFIDTNETVTEENTVEQCLTVVQALWDRGLLITQNPIN